MKKELKAKFSFDNGNQEDSAEDKRLSALRKEWRAIIKSNLEVRKLKEAKTFPTAISTLCLEYELEGLTMEDWLGDLVEIAYQVRGNNND